MWLNGERGFILDVKSARKIEKLLGDKRGVVQLRKQRGVYVIPYDKQTSNLFPLVEQESSQGRPMDRGEVEVEEERQAETSTKLRMRRFAAGARRVQQDVRQKIPTSVQQLNRRSHWWSWITDSSDVTRTWTWPRCQVLRKGQEPYATDCVLAYLGTWGLGEVLLEADNEPAIQALLTRFGSNVMRGQWWQRVRSTRTSQMVRSRMLCE